MNIREALNLKEAAGGSAAPAPVTGNALRFQQQVQKLQAEVETLVGWYHSIDQRMDKLEEAVRRIHRAQERRSEPHAGLERVKEIAAQKKAEAEAAADVPPEEEGG